MRRDGPREINRVARSSIWWLEMWVRIFSHSIPYDSMLKELKRLEQLLWYDEMTLLSIYLKCDEWKVHFNATDLEKQTTISPQEIFTQNLGKQSLNDHGEPWFSSIQISMHIFLIGSCFLICLPHGRKFIPIAHLHACRGVQHSKQL